MTLQHIFYIPTIFIVGFLVGALVSEWSHGRKPSESSAGAMDPGRGLSGKILLATFLIFICTFIITHMFPVPYGSKMVQNALGGLEIFDKQPSFSGADVYQRLQAYSPGGLEVYKTFTYTIDIIFPASLFFFLLTLARFVIQRTLLPGYLVRTLFLLPFIWLAFDLLENSIVFTLISSLPNRHFFLADILGFVTAIKFGLLLSSLVQPVLIFVFARISRARQDRLQ